MASLEFELEKRAFIDFYDSNLGLLKNFVAKISYTLKDLIQDMPDSDGFSVHGRVKDRNECIEKFVRKYKKIHEEQQIPYSIQDTISDLIGFRVVCIYIDQIAPIKEILASEFQMLDETNKIEQLQATENVFGYQALHMDMKLSQKQLQLKEYQLFSNLRFEIQIRTIIQDAWSVVDHKIKYKKEIPHRLKRKINVLSALFELADREFMSIQNEKQAFLEEIQRTLISDVQTNEFVSVIAFSGFLSSQFPNEPFKMSAAQKFLNELLVKGIHIGLMSLRTAFEHHAKTIDNFKIENQLSFNIFTFVRHILFAENPNQYALLLTKFQKEKFNLWLEKKKPPP